MIPAPEALKLLREGNRRFVSENQKKMDSDRPTKPADLAGGQQPFAVILGCADSRVPPEIIFDQSPGDLFVIRVAGNIVTPPLLGSIEFAADVLDTRLIVVLGHTNCGAVLATLDHLEQPGKEISSNLRTIVEHIRPSVDSIMANYENRQQDALVNEAVRANIRTAVKQVQQNSQVVQRQIRENDLRIVGAEYNLDTGVVEFFDDLP